MAKFVQYGDQVVNLATVKGINLDLGGAVQIDALILRGEYAIRFREWWGSERFHRWWESGSPLYVLEV